MKTIICILLISSVCFVQGFGQCANSIVFNDISKSVFLQPSNTYYTGNNDGFTWECWFKLNQSLGNEIRPLIVATDSVLYEDIWLGFGWNGGMFNQPANKLVFKVDGPNSAIPASLGCVYEPFGGFQVGIWYHVAGTMNYATHSISLFLNGQQVDSQVNNVTPITRFIATSLSCPQVANGQLSLHGNMDEVKIWSKPLSASEIASNYLLCRSGMESGLEIYYHCNEGTGYQLLVNNGSNMNAGNGTVPLPGGTWSDEPAPITDMSCIPQCDYCPDLYNGPEDLLICAGDSIQITAEPGWPFYNWYTSGSLVSSDFTGSLTVSPVVTTTYTIIATTMGDEMVVNPDFSLGNVGFTNDYTNSNVYNPCNYHVGNQFFTLPDTTFVDHTPTNDNMMLAIDGCSSGEILWEQTFSVVPNAGYIFSFWATRAAVTQPVFQTTLTGDVTGPMVASTLSGIPTTTQWIWDQYNGGFGLWNSGNNNTITITVRNLETNGNGNDFAMDDFSLKMQCTDIKEVTVYVNSIPLNLGPDLSLCDGVNHVIHAGNSYASYLWNDGTSADSLVITGSGTYWVTVHDNCGGIQTDTLQVTSMNVPNLDLGNDRSICAGDSTHFFPITGFSNLVWTGSGLSCSTCPDPTVFPSVSSSYSVVAFTPEGCSVSDTVEVTVVPLPQVDLGSDLFICSGDSVVLSNSVSLMNYQWLPAASISCTSCSAPVVHPAISATYVLTSQNVLGCSISDTVVVNVTPIPALELGDDLSICIGESAQINSSVSTLFTTFQWTPVSGLNCSNCPNPEANPLITTDYYFQATNAEGCSAMDSISVIVRDDAPQEVHVVVTDVTCQNGGTVAVEAVGDGSGELQFNFNQQGYSGNQYYSPVEIGNYTLFVRNSENGCPYQTVVVVNGEDGVVFIPNAFTPDGNEANNTWGIQGECLAEIVCRVYNRWGEEVATLTDISQQWDGTFHGSKVPDGVYTYQVVVTYSSEFKELITGSIAVLR